MSVHSPLQLNLVENATRACQKMNTKSKEENKEKSFRKSLIEEKRNLQFSINLLKLRLQLGSIRLSTI
jgi:hypothetical protein